MVTYLKIGFGNIVMASRIRCIEKASSASAKRIIFQAEQEDKLIDGTNGHQKRSLIFMDSDYVVVSAIRKETLIKRMRRTTEGK